MRFTASLAAGVIGTMALAGVASASQLTYAPVNPTFGGNPLNGSYLLSVAQSQGFGYVAKNASSSPDLSGLNQALQNLSTGLGNINVSPSIGAPVIIVNPISIPTSP